MTDPATVDYSFDKSGKFMLAHIYIAGATMQLDRYIEAEQAMREKDNNATRMFVVLHEVSCLVEDLASIAAYMRLGAIDHPKHKLWKQSRHHIRHDLRDPAVTDEDKGKTRTRLKYLKMATGLASTMQFKPDHFTIGGTRIDIDEVAEYLAWANDVLGRYTDYMRSTGQMESK